MNGHYTTRAGNVSYFLDLLHLFSLQSSRRVGPMPQRFMLSLHIHRHLFPVEVTPQLPLQVIEVYASISCWEPSTDMKSLLHFPQACRVGRLRDHMTSYFVHDVIPKIEVALSRYKGDRDNLRMRERVNHLDSFCACALTRENRELLLLLSDFPATRK